MLLLAPLIQLILLNGAQRIFGRKESIVVTIEEKKRRAGFPVQKNAMKNMKNSGRRKKLKGLVMKPIGRRALAGRFMYSKKM